MPEPDDVEEALEIRKVGADYEGTTDKPLDIPVDLRNFKKFPMVDPPGTYRPTGPDTRGDIRAEGASSRTTAGRSTADRGSPISPTRPWST